MEGRRQAERALCRVLRDLPRLLRARPRLREPSDPPEEEAQVGVRAAEAGPVSEELRGRDVLLLGRRVAVRRVRRVALPLAGARQRAGRGVPRRVLRPDAPDARGRRSHGAGGRLTPATVTCATVQAECGIPPDRDLRLAVAEDHDPGSLLDVAMPRALVNPDRPSPALVALPLLLVAVAHVRSLFPPAPAASIGEYVGPEEIADGVWTVYFGPLKLGRLYRRDV